MGPRSKSRGLWEELGGLRPSAVEQGMERKEAGRGTSFFTDGWRTGDRKMDMLGKTQSQEVEIPERSPPQPGISESQHQPARACQPTTVSSHVRVPESLDLEGGQGWG